MEAIPPKHQFLKESHCVISQGMAFFIGTTVFAVCSKHVKYVIKCIKYCTNKYERSFG
jgi:hypothetical protein